MSRWLPKYFMRHGGALDVPPRPARPPRTVPGGLAGLGRLPKAKSKGLSLPCVHLQPRSGDQLLFSLLRELAVIGKRLDPKEDVAAAFVRRSLSISPSIIAMMSPMCSDTLGYKSPFHAKAVHALQVPLGVVLGQLHGGTPLVGPVR